VGFEPKIKMFERAKKVHALGHADTVIGEQVRKSASVSNLNVCSTWVMMSACTKSIRQTAEQSAVADAEHTVQLCWHAT
jgi:hypothetical protein